MKSSQRNPSIPHRLRIPENLPRIHRALDAQQFLIRRRIEVRTVRLLRRQARVHIVGIAREGGPRLRLRDGAVQPLHERDDARGERHARVARVAVMLHHPEGGAIAVGAKGGGFGVDLAVGSAVEIDD